MLLKKSGPRVNLPHSWRHQNLKTTIRKVLWGW